MRRPRRTWFVHSRRDERIRRRWCASMLSGRWNSIGKEAGPTANGLALRKPDRRSGLLLHLNVVYEPGFAKARGSEYHQMARVRKRTAQVLRLTNRKVVGAHAGAFECLDTEALDTCEIDLAGAQPVRGGA